MAIGAVFNARVYLKISPAFVPQHIQRAIAKKAVKLFFVRLCVAGEILTVCIAKKLVAIHHLHLLQSSILLTRGIF